MKIIDWKMKFSDFEVLDCKLPCTMYSVLLEHKKIPDPYYGTNEQTATELSRKDCTFFADFNIDESELDRDFAELTFFGLDTLCDIFLNGALLGSVKNMHRTYVYDVKKHIKQGQNRIVLEFHSPIKYFEKMNDRHFLHSPYHTIPGAPHLRKCLSMSGWDWGPKLPDMGIFRDVELRTYDEDRIENVYITQDHKDNGEVVLNIAADTAKHSEKCELFVTVDGKRVKLSDKIAKITVENPKLWWPRGYGAQPLYDLTVELAVDGNIIDVQKKRIGLRTLTVSTWEHHGFEFAFSVNGIKIFAMGADYIPQDCLLSRISRERTEKLLLACCDANYNCIRVWGGGYFPEDDFYDICDELGLIVWQDFMAACVYFWHTAEFEKEFYEESVCNVKRIAHHASLGLLCGNNELERNLPRHNLIDETIKYDYIRLYEHILPDVCLAYAPDTFYWPSSPSSGGGFRDTLDDEKGDTHYWEVWHHGEPFTEYRKHKFRFCSEYGFESFPSMKTIRTFCPEDETNPFSVIMESHQKCDGGNTKILQYLADTYMYPYNIEDLVYASQLLQADAVRYGVEHFRRLRGYCMGSLYWQVNDCWPTASWSSIDYYGRYKALHYAAKKFYAPVSMGIFVENGKIIVNVSNERRDKLHGNLKLSIRGNDFSVTESKSVEFDMDELSSADVAYLPESCVKTPDSFYFCAELCGEDGRLIQYQTQLLVKPKHYRWQKPTLSFECRNCENGVEISLRSDVFAKSVELELDGADAVFSDNYFDIVSKDVVTVFAKTELDAKSISEKLKIKTVYDIGR